MANNYYDATGVLILDRVTPIITALFDGFKLDESHPGNGQAYVARIAEDSNPSWDGVLSRLMALAAQLDLPAPDRGDADDDNDSDELSISVVLSLLAPHFGADQNAELANLIERHNFEGDADLEALFLIAICFNDGHNLAAIQFEGCWHCSQPRLFEFGGDGCYLSREICVFGNSSDTLELGAQLRKAILAADVEEASALIALETASLLAGVSDDHFRLACRRALGANLVDRRGLTHFPYSTHWGSIPRRGWPRYPPYRSNPMSESNNPFIRGYRKLRIIRTLLITYDDDSPPVWRPLHSSQAHLPDDQVAQFPCLVGKDFALITEGQKIRPALEAKCQAEGIVRSVVYAIEGEDFDGAPMHVGDTYSEEAARELIERLSFETGVYSRCWEISTAHIAEGTWHYLAERADLDTPEAFLFIAFRIPYSPAIGVKLISTPWTDENLLQAEGITAEQLRHEHLSRGMPEDLAQVLALAGQADIRILILDAEAPVLQGLPLVDT